MLDGGPMTREEKICSAAFSLYIKHGPQKVSMQEIADTAGVSKKTLYNRFGNREKLLDRTIEWHSRRIVGFFENLMESDVSIAEKLVKAIEFVSRELDREIEALQQELVRSNPYLKDIPVNFLHKKIRLMLEQLVEQAKNAGLCRTDYSTRMIIYIILSMIKGLTSWKAVSDVYTDSKYLFGTTMKFILDAFLTEKGKKVLPIDTFQTL